ncbi:MAG: carbohydrate ABC transporter permease [Bacillota bacterium]
MKRRGKRERKSVGSWLVHVILLAGAILAVAPFVWMLSTSLKSLEESFRNVGLIPEHFVWSNYPTVLFDLQFLRYFANTAFVSVVATAGGVLASCMSGYAFARLRWPGRDMWFGVYLTSMMVPGQVTLVPLYILVRSLGWIDTFYALIVPSLFGGSFGAFLVRQYLLSVPREYDEAAIVDGANWFNVFWLVVIPLAKPAILTLSTLQFISEWNSYMWPLIVTSSERVRVLGLALAFMSGMHGTNWPYLMTGSVIACVPVFILFFFLQRYLVEGLVMSGLKA